MSEVDNEAKVQQSTRSLVLGKTKVMSYEVLEQVRAKSAMKEKANASKVKRCHRRRSPTLEAGEGPSVPKDKVARVSEVLESAKASIVP